MKAKEFIIEYKKDRKAPKYSLKPRSPVAHAAQSVISGSGPHKDKKKAEKQGDVKHKNKQYAEDAVADFLARGGEIQHGKFRKPRKSEKTDYGSKHIGGQRDAVAGKAGKTLGRAAATNFKGGGKPVVGSSYRGEGVRDLEYDAQSLIMKLRRDVEEKRLEPTRQAVLMAARELAGDMDFAPELLVRQVLGPRVEESSKMQFAGSKVGHKEGPAGQWRNDGPKKNKPAKPGDLVGGGT